MEKEWEKFRDIVMECINEVCGMKRVGRQRRNCMPPASGGRLENGFNSSCGWGGGRKENCF